jgi:hypothetical protein
MVIQVKTAEERVVQTSRQAVSDTSSGKDFDPELTCYDWCTAFNSSVHHTVLNIFKGIINQKPLHVGQQLECKPQQN